MPVSGLFRPPRLRSRARSEETRHANWLELFVDLIFVVAVTQLARRLTHGLSFTALFLPVWWSWMGTTFYAETVGAVCALCLAFCLAWLYFENLDGSATRAVERARTRLRILAGLVVLAFALVGTHLSAVLVIAFLATICAVQVVLDLRNDGEITEQGESDATHEGV